MALMFFAAMTIGAIAIYFGFVSYGFKFKGKKRATVLIMGWLIGLFFILVVSGLLQLSVQGSNDASMAYLLASIIIYAIKRKTAVVSSEQ